MAIKINSNGQSLAAQRQVAQTGDALGRVFGRLSSAQRINRASDDAAGLPIADMLNAKSRVFTTGIRNLNDGVSLLSVADSAIASLADITVRIHELAEQSANGVYSDKQRNAIDNEAQALNKEFTRITKTTSFNGLNLFDGSVQGLTLQAGFGVSGTVSASLAANLATGDFHYSTDLSIAATSLTTGDLNGDGYTDILTNTGGNNLNIILGKADGTFAAQTTLVGPAGTTNVVLADVNDDSILDIITQGSNTFPVVFLGKGDGSFGAAITTPLADTDGDGIAVADLNGDGYLDIATANGGSPIFTILNGDGRLDIITSELVSAAIFINLANPSGGYDSRVGYSASGDTDRLALGDFNGDGIIDVPSNTDVDTFDIFLGNGVGGFAPVQSFAAGAALRSVSVADINGDGILDLLGASLGEDGVSTLIGKGDGTFESFKIVGTDANSIIVLQVILIAME